MYTNAKAFRQSKYLPFTVYIGAGKLIPENFSENKQKVEALLFEYPDKHLGVEIYYRTLVTFHITVAH